MLCPVCQDEMLVLEHNMVEIDWCPECRGAWLDSGELELVSGAAGQVCAELEEALMGADGARPAGGHRPCPVCSRAMLEVETHTQPAVVVDRCPKQHGIWFDHGELKSVIEVGGGSETNPLANFFAELAGDQQD